MHVLLHTRHGATLDAAATGGGAGSPWTVFPTGITKEKRLVKSNNRENMATYLNSDIPRQWVVQVVRHDLLVAVASGERIKMIRG